MLVTCVGISINSYLLSKLSFMSAIHICYCYLMGRLYILIFYIRRVFKLVQRTEKKNCDGM